MVNWQLFPSSEKNNAASLEDRFNSRLIFFNPVEKIKTMTGNQQQFTAIPTEYFSAAKPATRQLSC